MTAPRTRASQTFAPDASPPSATFARRNAAPHPAGPRRKDGTPLTIADLDALDRRLVAAVTEHRANLGSGPTRRELRATLGLPEPPTYGPIVEAVREEFPGLAGRKLRNKVQRRREREDPLATRLSRLKRGQWISYTTEARSLGIGPAAVAAFQVAQSRMER